jgi:hypothetical protein
MECQLQMCEVAQKLVNTPLFNLQDLKLSTKDIIIILKDTLNTTLGPLPIPDPHATSVATLALGESVRMKVHTPKWTPILGVGVPVDSRTFRERLQGSKHFALRSALYHWKAIQV